MFRIRKAQADILRAPLIHNQLLELMAHLKKHFPDEAAALPDEALYERLKDTRLRSLKYGITSTKGLYQFVNVSMLYGADFDEQEETAWTKGFLEDEAVPNAAKRMNRLYEEVVHRLEIEESNAKIREKFYGESQSEEGGESP